MVDADGTKAGVTPLYGHVIIIMKLLPLTDNGLIRPEDEYADLEASMGLTVIHEMAHTFGMEDRYSTEIHDMKGMQCVMEKDDTDAENFYKRIANNEVNAFCDECAAILARHISS